MSYISKCTVDAVLSGVDKVSQAVSKMTLDGKLLRERFDVSIVLACCATDTKHELTRSLRNDKGFNYASKLSSIRKCIRKHPANLRGNKGGVSSPKIYE